MRPEWKLLINRRSGRSEQPGLPQRFGVTDKQVSGWMQGIVKAPDQGVPGRLIKINHHVAAENYIKFQPEVNGSIKLNVRKITFCFSWGAAV